MFEHEYVLQVDDQTWRDLADHVGQCIRTFHGSDTFGRIRAVDLDQWLEIEQLESFDLGGVKVYVMLDFAHRDGEEIVIYDWKTGKSKEDNALQFACYALYAAQRWDVPSDRIRAYEFNLARNDLREHLVDPTTAAAAHDYILESIGEMEGMLEDIPANRATEDAFPLTDDESACRFCNYRKACPRFGGSRET